MISVSSIRLSSDMFCIVPHADCQPAQPKSAALNAGTDLLGRAHTTDSGALASNNTKIVNGTIIPVEAWAGHISQHAWTFAVRKCRGACKAVTKNNSKHPSRNCGENCATNGFATMGNQRFPGRNANVGLTFLQPRRGRFAPASAIDTHFVVASLSRPPKHCSRYDDSRALRAIR